MKTKNVPKGLKYKINPKCFWTSSKEKKSICLTFALPHLPYCNLGLCGLPKASGLWSKISSVFLQKRKAFPNCLQGFPHGFYSKFLSVKKVMKLYTFPVSLKELAWLSLNPISNPHHRIPITIMIMTTRGEADRHRGRIRGWGDPSQSAAVLWLELSFITIVTIIMSSWEMKISYVWENHALWTWSEN